MSEFHSFLERFKLFATKNHELILITLSNIFTMRLIGNKTHGDLAEIGIAEFINSFIYDYNAKHVGKDLYRAKSNEEDILITNEISKIDFPVSLKAYGIGPLQLSTDKQSALFPLLDKKLGLKEEISSRNDISDVLRCTEFDLLRDLNVLPLIYDEKKRICNITVFDTYKAFAEVGFIRRISEGKGRIHKCFKFFDIESNYIFEVRYGGKEANALQRGVWTNTKNAEPYFNSITSGWINYSHNDLLVKVFSKALVASRKGHEKALVELENDIKNLKQIRIT